MSKRRRARSGTEARREEDRKDTGDPRREFEDAVTKASGPSGAARDEAVHRLKALASADGRYATRMCRLCYGSPCFPPDPLAAMRWAVRGMEWGDGDAAPWLGFFLITDDDLQPFRPEGYGSRAARPLKDGWFATDPDIYSHPALKVLKDLCGCGFMDRTSYRGLANREGGFENEVFSIRPMSMVPGRPIQPSGLVYRPTGLEMDLLDGGAGRMSMPLTNDDVVRVWLDCIASAVRTVERGASEGGPSGWRGHPVPVADRRKEVVRALELPKGMEWGDEMAGDISGISVSFDGPDRSSKVELERRGGLVVDGAEPVPWSAEAERLFYAAGRTWVLGDGAYRAARDGDARWEAVLDTGRGPLTMSGTVVPPFMESIASALGGLADSVPVAGAVAEGISSMPRVPVRPRATAVGRPYSVELHRHAVGRELVGSEPYVTSQDLTIGEGACELVTTVGHRQHYRVIEVGDEVIEDVFDLFDGRADLPEDPACPWWFEIFAEGGSLIASGRDALPLLEKVSALLGDALDDDGIRREMDEEFGSRFSRETGGIVLFDGLRRDYPDYYALYGGERRCPGMKRMTGGGSRRFFGAATSRAIWRPEARSSPPPAGWPPRAMRTG